MRDKRERSAFSQSKKLNPECRTPKAFSYHLSLITHHLPQHLCARMVFRVSDYLDAAAVGSYHIALGHRLLGVVSPLGVNVGPEREQKPGHGRLVEDRHVVHGAQRRDRLGPLALGDEGPALALQTPHLL